MASYTANYNLRKDASTDNYDVAVVNQNLDEIDEQMHQNEVASTTPFSGASSSMNGEKGIVPRPMAGDQEKYLKGDGTWGTPSGGGGGSSTLAGLSDVSLSSPSNGQVLKYNGSAWVNASGGGGGTLQGTALISSQITIAGTYTLNDDIENYDLISIVSGASNEADIRTLIVDDVLNMLSNNLTVNLPGTSGRWVNITALSGTSITVAMEAPIIHSITGYTWS